MSKILNHTTQKKSKQPERKKRAQFHPIRETTIKAARSHRYAVSRGENAHNTKEKPKREAAQTQREDAVKQFALLSDTNTQ